LTFFVGNIYDISHDCWTYCCQAISQGRRSTDFEDASSSSSSQTNIYPPQARDLVGAEQDSGKSRRRFEVLLEKGIAEDYDRFTAQALRLIEADNPPPPPLSDAVALQMPWVRPAFDGLLVHTSLRSSQVTDNFYDWFYVQFVLDNLLQSWICLILLLLFLIIWSSPALMHTNNNRSLFRSGHPQ
jgi:hypothetical protein